MNQHADGLANSGNTFNHETPAVTAGTRLPIGHTQPVAVVTTTTPTKSPTAQLSRKQILEATLSCLRELGYDGTTIRSIAKRLDCAVGSIYRYFKDKRELLDAVTQRRFESIAASLEESAGVEQSVHTYIRTAIEEPELYRLMFWINSVGRSREDSFPAVIQRILNCWVTRLGSEKQAQLLWAQIHAGIMLNQDAPKIVGQLQLSDKLGQTPPAAPDMPTAPQRTPPPRRAEDAASL